MKNDIVIATPYCVSTNIARIADGSSPQILLTRPTPSIDNDVLSTFIDNFEKPPI